MGNQAAAFLRVSKEEAGVMLTTLLPITYKERAIMRVQEL